MTWHKLSDLTAAIVSRHAFQRVIERLPNDARVEWLFDAVHRLEPSKAKRLILQARNPEVAFLDDGQADLMLDALGIREA